MGCLKLTYRQEEGLEKSVVYLGGSLKKKGQSLKKCDSYYPFGLQANSSYSIADIFNNRLFNAGSELNENTKNYETFYRNYDPALGRFNGIDSKATSYSSTSPYVFAGNDPVYYNDPMGDDYYYNPDTGWEYGEGVNEPMPANPGGGGYGGYHGTNRGYSTTLINRMKSLSSMGALSFGQGDYSHLFAAAAPNNSMDGQMTANAFISTALNSSSFGGNWQNGNAHFFTSNAEARAAGQRYYNKHFGSYMDYRWRKSQTENITASADSDQPALILGNTLNEYIASFLYYSPLLGIAPNPYKGRVALFGDLGGILAGSEKDWGGIFILVGKDAGKFLWYNELAGGAAPELGVGAEIGVYEYTGNHFEVNASFFKGERWKIWIGGGPNIGFFGISGGVGVSWTSIGDHYLYAIGLQLGGGVSTPISGGYNFGEVDIYD